jgi:hypothetical protein
MIFRHSQEIVHEYIDSDYTGRVGLFERYSVRTPFRIPTIMIDRDSLVSLTLLHFLLRYSACAG